MPYKHYLSYSMYIGGGINLIGYETKADRDNAYDQYTRTGTIVEGEPPHHSRISPFRVCMLDIVACAEFHPVH